MKVVVVYQDLAACFRWALDLLEKGYNFGCQDLCSSKSLGVQHDLRNQLAVWLGHGEARGGEGET